LPTYEYKCSACGHRYETREGFDSPPRQSCPKCGEIAKRVLFPPPIVFKGSGFYVTDSRKGSSATIGDSSYTSNGSDSSPEPTATTPSTPATSDSDG
jgi:putative FmdB family regulatory protein